MTVDPWAAQSFTREPGRVIGEALRRSDDVFGAYLDFVDCHDVDTLKLGKRAQDHYLKIVELERNLDRYSYMSPRAAFNENDLDQARAAGVLLEIPGTRAVVLDRDTYRSLQSD